MSLEPHLGLARNQPVTGTCLLYPTSLRVSQWYPIFTRYLAEIWPSWRYKSDPKKRRFCAKQIHEILIYIRFLICREMYIWAILTLSIWRWERFDPADVKSLTHKSKILMCAKMFHEKFAFQIAQVRNSIRNYLKQKERGMFLSFPGWWTEPRWCFADLVSELWLMIVFKFIALLNLVMICTGLNYS